MSSENKQANLDNFIQKEEIGSGSFGTVYIIEEKSTREVFAAKVLNLQTNSITQEEMISLSHEVNINAGLNHPACLKFVGYSATNFHHEPNPVIITEYCKNGSLLSIIKDHEKYSAIWDDTKKLISIFGVASGMMYLHSHGILHRDLKTDNILMDNVLCPKISDFGLSKKKHFDPRSMSLKSKINVKGTPAYIAPEVFKTQECTEKNDVYAFGFLVYEIITNVIPLELNADHLRFLANVSDGKRPLFDDSFPASYANLIERCLSLEANDRPSFDEIVNVLKSDKGFITSKVKEEDYRCYIKFIEDYPSSFDSHKIIKIEDCINSASKAFQKVDIKKYLEQPKKTFTSSFLSLFGVNQEKLFPADLFEKLDESCQKLVVEAENDADKQFLIGTFLIEGNSIFPLNIDLGIKYLERSISGGSIESALYLSNIFIQGRLVPRDLKRAKKYLSKYKSDAKTTFCYGQISKKENKIKEARQIFQRGTELGDSSCMYEYGKMVFKGEEGYKDIIDAINFIQLSKGKGYPKSKLFLQIFDKMKKDKSFSGLPPEVQYFFIKQNFRYNKYNSTNDGEIKMNKEIKMKFKDTEKLFLNKSFESTNFIELLQRFEYIEIEILYPTKLFDNIFSQIISIKQNIISKLILLIFISGIKSVSKRFQNNQFIDIVNIDSGIKTIEASAFEYCVSLKYISIPSSVTSIGDCAFRGCSSLREIANSSSVTKVGESTFNGCSSLREITIPSSVTEIKVYAFRGCSLLKEITIPSYVTSIGDFTFYECSSLAEIKILSSLKRIGDSAFSKCSSLTKITIPSSVTSIGNYAFEKCSLLTEITISSSLRKIGDFVFYECSSLARIAIPSSVTSIGNSAFEGCSSLAEITIPSSVKSIGDSAFSECSSLTQLAIPSSVTKIGENAFPSNKNIVKV